MKLVCERGHLNAALSLVIGRAKANQTIQILYHVLLTAADGRLRLCATDMEAMSESHLGAEVQQPGRAVLDAHRLAKLVSGFPKGAQISLDGNEEMITVKCGRSTYNLPSMPPADWPMMETEEDPTRFSLDATLVRALFETPAAACEPPKGRIYLTGGYLHQPAKDKISVVATDGKMLIQYTADCDFALERGIIVPKSSMAEIAKIAAGTVKFECTQNLIVVETEACRFTSKLIDAIFPDYQRVMPPASGPSILVEREELIAAVRRLDMIGDGDTTARLDWKEGGSLTITLNGKGSGEEQVAGEIEMPGFGGIGLGPALLLPALESFKGDSIRLFMTDAGAPVRLSDSESGEVSAVVMPKRF